MAEDEVKGIVGEIREFCLHDGPGVRTTLFLRGCPLRCPWCHNPEFVLPEAEPGTVRSYTPDEAAQRILRNRDILTASGGGVTFSGGEPLMQWDFVSGVISRLDGLHTVVETSGFAPEETYRDMLKKCSFVFQDVKCMDPVLHKRLTGQDNGPILHNLRLLQSSGKPYTIRMPFVPGINDDMAEVEALARFAAASPGALRQIELLPYHGGGASKLKKLGLPLPPGLPESDGTVPEEAKEILQKYFPG